MDTAPAPQRPLVAIRYCPKCRWLTRAAWLAQELLITFPDAIDVLLSPGESGVFDVTLDGALLFSRAAAERFPEPKELKQAIRDRIDPDRSLGHSDR
ncbi:SelT/SelW/SelH family protein [Sorangium sp. So ce1335]|uniref:SelT/SelW/SelH family protein n=1 Tax=Sorangium sp. So ce1335 TaxID=3133335 RepID=UPI003F5D63BE